VRLAHPSFLQDIRQAAQAQAISARAQILQDFWPDGVAAMVTNEPSIRIYGERPEVASQGAVGTPRHELDSIGWHRLVKKGRKTRVNSGKHP